MPWNLGLGLHLSRCLAMSTQMSEDEQPMPDRLYVSTSRRMLKWLTRHRGHARRRREAAARHDHNVHLRAWTHDPVRVCDLTRHTAMQDVSA